MTPKSTDLYMLAYGSVDIKGQWERALAGDKAVALVSCPACGRIMSLSHYSIDEKGFVSPSLICDGKNGGCGFHGYIKLEGWQP